MAMTPEQLVALSNPATQDDALLPAAISVELPADDVDDITIDLETGEVVIDTGDKDKDEEGFDANLAESLDKLVLTNLGEAVVRLTESDDQARAGWYEKIVKGFKSLGVYKDIDANAGQLTDMQQINHPLVLEAATQFQARAMAELYPASGPVKAHVLGKPDEERLAQAERVDQYMNYQLTVEDRGYYDDRDAMMFRLAFTGSEFDKQFEDPRTKQNRSRWVKCEDFIVPPHTTSLEDAPRYAHRIRMTQETFDDRVTAGVYIKPEKPLGADNTLALEGDAGEVQETLDKIQGEDASNREDEDAEITFYESHIDYHLEDLHKGLCPYIVTVDKASKQVVGVRRNWREGDELYRKRVWFTHKKLLPGFGFYGWGFIHTIGTMGEVATQILNILLDSGAFNSIPGGFKSKDAKMKGDIDLEPGIYKDTEMTAEELGKAFFTPPFKEPSAVLNAVLGVAVDMGRRFAATTDQMVGDAANTGPVGTTVALIEQGSKVYSGIHKRIHKACGDEFMHLAELNGESLPDSYPFSMRGGDYAVAREDFDERVDVVPVSDPNIFSSAQRIAQAQAELQLAQSMPNIADQREAARSMLRALRSSNVDKIIPEPAEAQTADPITEGALVMVGRPIHAAVTQNHSAHIAVHQSQFEQLQQINPQAAQAMLAHLQEHMAMAYMLQMQQMMQMPLPPMDYHAKMDKPMAQPVPPEVENEIALRAQQAVMQMQAQAAAQAQAQAAQGQPGAQDPAAAAQDMQIKDAAAMAEEKRKDMAFAKEQQRKDAEMQAQLAMDQEASDREMKIDPQLLRQAREFVKATGADIAPKRLAAASQALGRSFADVIQALSVMSMGGQGAGPAPVTKEIMGRREYT